MYYGGTTDLGQCYIYYTVQCTVYFSICFAPVLSLPSRHFARLGWFCQDPTSKLYLNLRLLRHEIFNRGPVVVPVLLKDDFLVYKSGVYTPTDNANQQYGANLEPLLHAVTIMGWGRSEGTPYWLVAGLFWR